VRISELSQRRYATLRCDAFAQRRNGIKQAIPPELHTNGRQAVALLYEAGGDAGLTRNSHRKDM